MFIHRLPVQNGLVQYSQTEEKVHVLSHFLGILLGFGMMVAVWLCHSSTIGLIGGMVHAVSLVILYSASCLYHGMPAVYSRQKRVLQVIDHCSIFILIAGSGTPFILCTISGFSVPFAAFFNILMWGCAALGIVLLIIDLKKFKPASILLYLVMGFSVLAKNAAMKLALGPDGYALLLGGGVIYCIGLVFYGIKVRWTHSVFHLLCIVASILHCICVCRFVI